MASCSLSPPLASHGPALVAIVDGCPPGLRSPRSTRSATPGSPQPGTSRHTTQRLEADEVEILPARVRSGRTTGCSIGLLICNTDQKSKDYSAITRGSASAHADYTYHHKYGERD